MSLPKEEQTKENEENELMEKLKELEIEVNRYNSDFTTRITKDRNTIKKEYRIAVEQSLGN